MSGWADVSSALAGALVFVIGAARPHLVNAIERLLDGLGAKPSVETPPSAEPPAPPS